MKYHLAQINVARMHFENIEAPAMESFRKQLDSINAQAERTPGFVWRLKDDTNNAMAYDPYDDPQIIVNISVWETITALKDFTYHTAHAGLIRQRKEWFQAFGKAYYALWWIPKGTHPSLKEAQQRLEYLQENGPTPHSFDFKQAFTPTRSDENLHWS